MTAAAISYYLKNHAATRVPIKTKGGLLEVHFEPVVTSGARQEGVFQNVWLCGPALQVFEGVVEV